MDWIILFWRHPFTDAETHFYTFKVLKFHARLTSAGMRNVNAITFKDNNAPVSLQVLKIWDIPSQQCLKTILLQFPNIHLDFTPEHGSFPLLLSMTPDPILLVTCREYLATLHLHKSESNSSSGLYTCALYNPHHQQVGVWVRLRDALWTEHYV